MCVNNDFQRDGGSGYLRPLISAAEHGERLQVDRDLKEVFSEVWACSQRLSRRATSALFVGGR